MQLAYLQQHQNSLKGAPLSPGDTSSSKSMSTLAAAMASSLPNADVSNSTQFREIVQLLYYSAVIKDLLNVF